MATSILDTLNKAQCRAVTSEAATVAILAGPGSGKTHTLTSRVVWLIDSLGHQPDNIIVATFTVKAAREMKERIGKALGNGREKRIILGTFHSIARRYLAAYGSRIGLSQKFGIADSNDTRSIIERICKRLQLAVDPVRARNWISQKKSRGNSDNTLKRKPSDKSPNEQDCETCYEEYQDHLKRSNLLDYDDLLVYCVDLLRQHAACVSNIQAVLIDEYQDTNGIQYELMKLFAQKNNRITIVGDPDQSIYGWRSAEIKNLWKLLRDFPGTDEISLEENYRSFQSILDVSLQVIQQDTKRYNKLLKPIHHRGTRPVLRTLRTAANEADWIVSEIRRTTSMSGGMMTPNDVAVLLRSAHLSRHVESSLGKAGIAYQMIGGKKFYDRKEIKVLINYLRVIHQPENNDALAEIMNVPRRGIGEGTTKTLIEEAEKSGLSLWTLLEKHFRGDRLAKTKIMKAAEQKLSGELFRLMGNIRRKVDDISRGTPFSLVEMLDQLLTALSFQKYLQMAHPEDHEQRWANVQEFINLAADFVRDLDQAGDDSLPELEGLQQSKETDVLPRFLANVSLASDAQINGNEQESTPHVTLSTIHAAKGLEWPIVFIPSVVQGSLPHSRSEDSDEERRLLYVAMTRAQSLLYLSCSLYSSMEGGGKNQLSEFVAPLAKVFAKRGPCLDRPIMEAIAKVLDRKLPSDQSVFDSLPQGFIMEDNLYPEDPEAERKAEMAGASTDGTQMHRMKRQRLHASAANGTGGGDSSRRQDYQGTEYRTTMDQSSHFTMAALLGFVSAGSHQVQLAAAAEANKIAKAQKVAEVSAKKRPANQASIVGFVSTKSGHVAAQAHRPDQKPQTLPPSLNVTRHVQRVASTPKPTLDPILTAHKLTPTKWATKPGLSKHKEEGARKNYAAFSSSPPRPAEADQEPGESPPSPTRPASSLHNTTVSMPTGLGGGFRRPPGLGRDGIAPISRVRKPFKPLTINRT